MIVAWPTVASVEDVMFPFVAVIVAVPTPALAARPLLPTALLITITAAEDELHVTIAVMSFVLPSV